MKNDQSIQLNITIQPPAANGKRKIVVSGAPEGEMPHILTGDFPQMHALIDQTYVALLKRDPQVVKVKAAKGDDGGAKKRVGAKHASPKAKPDQLDHSDEPADDDLPVIEGDTATNLTTEQPNHQLTLELETPDNG